MDPHPLLAEQQTKVMRAIGPLVSDTYNVALQEGYDMGASIERARGNADLSPTVIALRAQVAQAERERDDAKLATTTALAGMAAAIHVRIERLKLERDRSPDGGEEWLYYAGRIDELERFFTKTVSFR